MLPDSWKKRLQLHRQTDVSSDLEPTGHGDRGPAQLAIQNLDAVFSTHREYDVRVLMRPLCDLTDPLPDRENELPSLCAAQIELIDRIEIFGRI